VHQLQWQNGSANSTNLNVPVTSLLQQWTPMLKVTEEVQFFSVTAYQSSIVTLPLPHSFYEAEVS